MWHGGKYLLWKGDGCNGQWHFLFLLALMCWSHIQLQCHLNPSWGGQILQKYGFKGIKSSGKALISTSKWWNLEQWLYFWNRSPISFSYSSQALKCIFKGLSKTRQNLRCILKCLQWNRNHLSSRDKLCIEAFQRIWQQSFQSLLQFCHWGAHRLPSWPEWFYRLDWVGEEPCWVAEKMSGKSQSICNCGCQDEHRDSHHGHNETEAYLVWHSGKHW